MMKLYENALYREDIKKAAELNFSWEKLQDKSVLIAGATGLIGRCMIDILMYKNINQDLNCHIYAMSRNTDSAKQRFEGSYFESSLFTFVEQDVQFPIELAEGSQVDYVLHMASNTHPRAYATEPIDTVLTNVYGTKNLLDFCVQYEVKRFVFPSSVEIYGENRGDVEKFDEHYVGYLDSNTMRAGYPESKRCCEALCQAYMAEKGLDVVIPRLPRIYGPTMQEGDSKAVAQFIKKASAGEDIVLKSEGNQFYSFLYVIDAVTGILSVMLNGKSGEAYNIASESNDATLKETVSILADLGNVKMVFELPDEVEKAGYSTATKARLDGSKVEKIGWKPEFTIFTGLKRTMDILGK